jgi:hypothetical protein
MTPKKTKGALKFHQDWEVKYAVQICTRDPASKDVTSVVRLLCTNFGRDQIIAKQTCSFVIDGDIGAKIIVDLLLTPARIEGGDAEVDDVDISSATPTSIALSEGEEGDDRNDELPNSDRFATLEKKRVLKMFVYNPEDDLYTAKVNSVLKLNHVAKLVSIEVSFRQGSKDNHLVKEETGMGSLVSVNDYDVG